MKLMHLSDLHIGKRVNEMNMLEDQKYILKQILSMMEEHKPKAVLIAGDVYDKSVPSADAVEVFDSFLTDIVKQGIQVCVISGNHDSPERLNFGNQLMRKSGVFLSGTFDGRMQCISLNGEGEEVIVYLLPFVKPAMVHRFFPDCDTDSYEASVKVIMEDANIDMSKNNILVAHQFVTNGGTHPDLCESETKSIGGLDNIDASVFDAFDYVALGHIHGPQKMGRETIRYCGSPLKYSFSEVNHKKSVTMIEIVDKKVRIEILPLIPLRNMRKIRGPLEELLKQATDTQDYIQAILTDEEMNDAIGKMRSVYPNTLKIEFDNIRSNTKDSLSEAELIENKTALVLFGEFYEKQNGSMMDERRTTIVQTMLERMGGEEI